MENWHECPYAFWSVYISASYGKCTQGITKSINLPDDTIIYSNSKKVADSFLFIRASQSFNNHSHSVWRKIKKLFMIMCSLKLWRLTNEPLLTHHEFDEPVNLTIMLNNYAMLSQGAVGKDKSIAYATMTFYSAELNYSAIEKELLVIVSGRKTFHLHYYGQKFYIVTNHKPYEDLSFRNSI